MIRVSITHRALNPRKVIGNVKTKTSKSFREISKIAKDDIKTELRSPKTGRVKPIALTSRYKASPIRRSARGESLARETGASERLITTQRGVGVLRVGFKNNPSGDNYVLVHELRNYRPTVRNSMNKTLPKFVKIMQKNFNV